MSHSLLEKVPCKNTLIGIADNFERCLDIQCSVYNLVLYKIYRCEDTVFSPGIRSAVHVYVVCTCTNVMYFPMYIL